MPLFSYQLDIAPVHFCSRVDLLIARLSSNWYGPTWQYLHSDTYLVQVLPSLALSPVLYEVNRFRMIHWCRQRRRLIKSADLRWASVLKIAFNSGEQLRSFSRHTAYLWPILKWVHLSYGRPRTEAYSRSQREADRAGLPSLVIHSLNHSKVCSSRLCATLISPGECAFKSTNWKSAKYGYSPINSSSPIKRIPRPVVCFGWSMVQPNRRWPKCTQVCYLISIDLSGQIVESSAPSSLSTPFKTSELTNRINDSNDSVEFSVSGSQSITRPDCTFRPLTDSLRAQVNQSNGAEFGSERIQKVKLKYVNQNNPNPYVEGERHCLTSTWY